VLLENPFHQGHHDDGGGHVVKDGGEEKGDKGNYPEQARELGGLDPAGNNLETAMAVGYLHNGHGADEKEDNGRSFGELFG